MTNEELADGLKQWAHDRRNYQDEYPTDEPSTELLDEAARRLREQGSWKHDCEHWQMEGIACARCNPAAVAIREQGERIEGWAYPGDIESFAAQSKSLVPLLLERTGSDVRNVRVSLILNPQEPDDG